MPVRAHANHFPNSVKVLCVVLSHLSKNCYIIATNLRIIVAAHAGGFFASDLIIVITLGSVTAHRLGESNGASTS
ncbi:Uncharacterised protein [Moraxella atlantae]|uniref:Uncharacterized protein n=1 Tax=Faucicola atlantae TaxID=34059 RepID=A0A378Q0N1_9GAMM|nr:Uncharacterised protein [Moraxella atlantae]